MLSSNQSRDASGMRSRLTSYGDNDFSLFLRKAFIKGAGYSDDALERPIIGIVDTSSGFNPCHGNVKELVEAVKRGVLLSGALPISFPTISLHESFAHPTSMFLRNLQAMDTEEMLRAQPMDAVVLIGGCDKTVPAQLMGALSADIPSIQLVAGPMMAGSHEGVRIGACTDCRRLWALHRAGELDIEDIARANNELVPTVGTCGVMGTASTMACISEAMGMMPLGSATAPAVSAARVRIAERTGALAADAARNGTVPSKVVSKESFENALTVLQAIGGSTNAIVHLLAIAGRMPGIDITLDDVDRIGRQTPLLVDLKPSGANYMEDFHRAGGMPALLRELSPLLHLSAMTISGKTLGEELAGAPRKFIQAIIRPLSDPLYPASALIVLAGNLAPDGAVLKQSAASPALLSHTGPAVVFDGPEDLAARIDAADLDVTAESVLVLRGIGPVGHPGMPEAGLIPIPKKLASAGVRDMLRISDGRMSGTAAGTVILHVAPEAAVGGPLALIRDGDVIRLDTEQRLLSLELDEEELQRRRAALQSGANPSRHERGYRGLYKRSVMQSNYGADFDFLRADAEVGM